MGAGRATLLATVASVVAIGAMIGLEVVFAMRREYLPTEPVMQLGGTFGPPDGTPLRFAVLGDSTAAGVGAVRPAAAYPTLLAERLAATGYRVEMRVFGTSGARVKTVLEDQALAMADLHSDLVFVGIGANDVIHVTPLDEVRSDMGRLVERLRAASGEVVVAGPPDMRAPAFHEPLRSLAGRRGRRVEAAISDAALERGAAVVPLYSVGHHFAEDPEGHYSDDAFHPGPGGYRRWADAIFPYLARTLAEA
jgi:lysophospholipase L1-like esterase